MRDLLIRGGRIIDPVNGIDMVGDVAVDEGKVVEVAKEIEGGAHQVVDAKGKLVVPGIIDMHTHMRTVLGHPHAQRMLALAGVTTTLDMAGPLDNILGTIDVAGAGINIAILEAAQEGVTLKTNRPDSAERLAMIDSVLERGAIGVKLMGGHFPMDLDICAGFIEDAAKRNCWIAWHAGNSTHGSNILGMRDAIESSNGHFLHVAHVNSYCRAQVKDEMEEALEGIELLKANPQIFSESYLSDLNGTGFQITKEDQAWTRVTQTCLKKKGYTNNYAGMRQAILDGKAGVLVDDGTIGKLIYGQEGVDYWEAKKTDAKGSFSVNPAISRFLMAQAKRADGTFVVDCLSTDGGCYPRNVIVENGLCLVQFGALTLNEFVLKSSINGAKALGIPSKGHLSVGADADIAILDFERKKTAATICGGKIIMVDGIVTGRGTTIVCDERGEAALKRQNIPYLVKQPLKSEDVQKRLSIH